MRAMLLVSLGLAGLVAAGPASAASVGLQQATATFSQTSFPVGQAIDGLLPTISSYNGWAIHPDEGNQTAAFESAADTPAFAGGTALTFTLNHTFFNPLSTPSPGPSEHALGRFRLSVTTGDRSTFADGVATGGDVTADTGWTVLDPSSYSSANGQVITKLADKSLLVTENDTLHEIYTVLAYTALTGITGFRLEVMTDPSLPHGGPGLQDSNGNFVLAEFSVDAAPVPEPTTLLLWGTTAVGLAVARRLRQRRAA